MNIKEKSKEILIKLQNLSETKKKLILWLVVLIAAIILSSIFMKTVTQKLDNIKLPEFGGMNINSSSTENLNTIAPTTEEQTQNK